MSSNVRQHALFIIGSNDLPESELNQVLDNINSKYGGCTLHKGLGVWSENGAEFTTDYSDSPVKFETAYQIEVCSELSKFDFDYLKSCFIPASPYAQWIHCETWQTLATHFDIQELALSQMGVTV